MNCDDPRKEEYVWELLEMFGFDKGSLDDDLAIFVNPTYGTAVVGITPDGTNVIYDWNLMIEYLIEYEDMDYDEAIEFIDYNSSYHITAAREPIIMYSFTADNML